MRSNLFLPTKPMHMFNHSVSENWNFVYQWCLRFCRKESDAFHIFFITWIATFCLFPSPIHWCITCATTVNWHLCWIQYEPKKKYNFLYKKSQRCVNKVKAPVFAWSIQSRVHSFRRFINISGSGTYGVLTQGVSTPVPLPSYIFQAFKGSTVRWRPCNFFFNFNDTISREGQKTI